MTSTTRRNFVLITLIVVTLVVQARFLFVYPVPDTGMWFGDESWTMLTLRAIARGGVARVPEALGSSLAHSNGLINGSIWISGAMYGFPATLLAHAASLIAIGRIITFALSLLLLPLLYRLSRFLGTSSTAALMGIFALVLSDAFYFSSHSARLDMATGLAILFYFFIIAFAFSRLRSGSSIYPWAFWLPFVAAISIAVYVHVPTLIFLPMLYSLWELGMLKHWKSAGISLAGLSCGVALMVGIYLLSTGSLDLLGKGYNQYYNVAYSLPILHPFSWQVQKINTIDRAIQLWGAAWPLMIALGAGLAFRVFKRVPFQPIQRFFIINSLFLVLSWCLFGGPAIFYIIYILPVLAICSAILLESTVRERFMTRSEWIGIAVAVLVAAVIVVKQERFGTVGERLTIANEDAVHRLLKEIVRNNSTPPIVLTDEPAEYLVAQDTNVQLMTKHFLLFGSEPKSTPEILSEYHVRYLLLYAHWNWHSLLQDADSNYTVAAERIGTFTDLGRTYDEPRWNDFDTLRLYERK